MATDLPIDPDLLSEALRLSGEKSEAAAITKALVEFVARRRRKDLLDLFGKLEWDDCYAYKAGRSRSRGSSAARNR